MKLQSIILILLGLIILYRLFLRFAVPPLLLWTLKKKLSLLEKTVSKYLTDKELLQKVEGVLSKLDLNESGSQTRTIILQEGIEQEKLSNKDTYNEVSALQETLLETERVIDMTSKKWWPDSYHKKLEDIKTRTRELRKKVIE